MTKRIILVGFVFLLLVTNATSSSPSSMGQAPTADALRGLQSSDPLIRMRSFEVLKRMPGSVTGIGTVNLLNLLDRENQLIEVTLRKSNSVDGIAAIYGEGFAEYYKDLLETVDLTASKDDPKVVEVLANGAYSAGSVFSVQLAEKYGSRILPVIVKKAKSDVISMRHDGIEMLSVMSGQDAKLSNSDKDTIRNVIIAATSDPAVQVRHVAVRALGNIGRLSDLELLGRIAERDQTREVIDTRTRYPVREEAQRAMDKIQQRGR